MKQYRMSMNKLEAIYRWRSFNEELPAFESVTVDDIEHTPDLLYLGEPFYNWYERMRDTVQVYEEARAC